MHVHVYSGGSTAIVCQWGMICEGLGEGGGSIIPLMIHHHY